MNILEEQLLEDLDQIILEDFPPIFTQLKKQNRDVMSNAFAIGPNSTQKEVKKDELKDVKSILNFIKKNSNNLIVVMDEEYDPIAYFTGHDYGLFRKYQDEGERGEQGGNFKNRADIIRFGKKIYVITPDEETYKTVQKRTERGPYKAPEYEKETKTTFITPEMKEAWKNRLVKYLKNKESKIIEMLPKVQKALQKEQEKAKKKFLDKIKKGEYGDSEYSFGRTYVNITNVLTNLMRTFKEFKHKVENGKIEKGDINMEVKNVSTVFDELKRKVKA